jgi:IS5 family transposase
MEKQQIFTDMEYAQRKRVSRREAFLETMNKLVPWQRLEEKIRPHYYAGKRGLQKALFETVKEVLEEQGKIMHGGSILDAAIIEVPASTKNSAKSRYTAVEILELMGHDPSGASLSFKAGHQAAVFA